MGTPNPKTKKKTAAGVKKKTTKSIKKKKTKDVFVDALAKCMFTLTATSIVNNHIIYTYGSSGSAPCTNIQFSGKKTNGGVVSPVAVAVDIDSQTASIALSPGDTGVELTISCIDGTCKAKLVVGDDVSV